MAWPCLMFVKCYPQMALNEKSEKRSKLLIFICQNIGLLSGWGIMFLLSYYEEELLHLKIFHRWRGVVTPSTPSFTDDIILLMERMNFKRSCLRKYRLKSCTFTMFLINNCLDCLQALLFYSVSMRYGIQGLQAEKKYFLNVFFGTCVWYICIYPLIACSLLLE